MRKYFGVHVLKRSKNNHLLLYGKRLLPGYDSKWCIVASEINQRNIDSDIPPLVLFCCKTMSRFFGSRPGFPGVPRNPYVTALFYFGAPNQILNSGTRFVLFSWNWETWEAFETKHFRENIIAFAKHWKHLESAKSRGSIDIQLK